MALNKVCPHGRNDNIFVVDDFYSDPLSVLELARESDFSVSGNYPGMRSRQTEKVLGTMSKALKWHGFDVMAECVDSIDPNNDYDKYTGTFQLCLDGARTWIHRDNWNAYAAVVFLTLPETYQWYEKQCNQLHGTTFHIHTPSYQWYGDEPVDWNDEPVDENDWDVWRSVEGKFNRAVIFNADMYHRSALPGFGTSIGNGRLTQVGFF